MPIHDWSRVSAGIFHHFHQRWIGAISDALNGGLLPSDYYALEEQIVGDLGPDVLALQYDAPPDAAASSATTLSAATAPPQVDFVAQTEMDGYTLKQSTLVIRHTSGDRIVALVEIVSPGNKASRHGLRTFVEKAAAALYRGYHLLVLDLHPPTARDPQGIHGAVWEEIADGSYRQPPGKPFTLVAYDAGVPKTAYVKAVAVGDPLPDMPLFLEPQTYVNAPLEGTYQAAWQGVPLRWQRVLEAPAG